jgi:hypothetical protein
MSNLIPAEIKDLKELISTNKILELVDKYQKESIKRAKNNDAPFLIYDMNLDIGFEAAFLVKELKNQGWTKQINPYNWAFHFPVDYYDKFKVFVYLNSLGK